VLGAGEFGVDDPASGLAVGWLGSSLDSCPGVSDAAVVVEVGSVADVLPGLVCAGVSVDVLTDDAPPSLVVGAVVAGSSANAPGMMPMPRMPLIAMLVPNPAESRTRLDAFTDNLNLPDKPVITIGAKPTKICRNGFSRFREDCLPGVVGKLHVLKNTS
jgi:hypothetical protein